MTKNDKAIETTRVSCAACLKEVPITEAVVPEAIDYFMHFCGLECYEKWQAQKETPAQLPLQADSASLE